MQNLRAVQPAQCRIGRDRGYTAKAVESLVSGLVDQEKVTEPFVSVGQFGVEAERTAISDDRRAVTALLIERDPEIVMGDRVSGIEADRSFEAAGCFHQTMAVQMDKA